MKFFNKVKKIVFSATALSGSILSYAADPAPAGSTTPLCSLSGANTTGCDINTLKTNINGQLTSGAQIFYAGAAIIGIALVVIGLLKLKAHAMDTQGTSGHLRAAIWMLIIGGLLIAVPVVMLLGSNTITGTTITLPSESKLFT
jgi:hypothetical protein